MFSSLYNAIVFPPRLCLDQFPGTNKWLKTGEVYSFVALEATSQNQRLSRTASSGVSSEESLASPLPFSGGFNVLGFS